MRACCTSGPGKGKAIDFGLSQKNSTIQNPSTDQNSSTNHGSNALPIHRPTPPNYPIQKTLGSQLKFLLCLLRDFPPHQVFHSTNLRFIPLIPSKFFPCFPHCHNIFRGNVSLNIMDCGKDKPTSGGKGFDIAFNIIPDFFRCAGS